MAVCQADRYRCLAVLVSSYRFCVYYTSIVGNCCSITPSQPMPG
jgi:hypothetical protein